MCSDKILFCVTFPERPASKESKDKDAKEDDQDKPRIDLVEKEAVLHRLRAALNVGSLRAVGQKNHFAGASPLGSPSAR